MARNILQKKCSKWRVWTHAVKLGMDDRPNLTEEIRGMLLQAAEYLKKDDESYINGLERQIRQLIKRCQVAEAKLYKIKKLAEEA